MVVLAVGIVGLGSIWAMADSSSVVQMSVQILPAGGETVSVTVPNGGESWEIGTNHNITWTASGTITDVMIELQRTVAGPWETIIASTPNDGSYPWTVTGAATTTATVRISKVGDASVNDSSDATFSIVVAPVVPSTTGGGGGIPQMSVDGVVPNTAVKNVDTLVKLTGQNFDSSVKVKLNTTVLSRVTWVDAWHLEMIVPKGFPVGVYSLTVFDNSGKYVTWGSLFRVVDVTPAPAPNLFYASRWSSQSVAKISLNPGQETTVWVEFVNSGTLPWTNFGKNPVRLGTSSPRDRLSKFKATWLSGWVLKNRPANVARQGQKAGGQQTINPGEIGRFTFKLKAPSRAGKYVENFGTVVEFRQWMTGTAQFEITVVPKPTVKKVQPKLVQPKVSQPLLPSLDIWKMPNLPEPPSEEFYDVTEGIFRTIGGLLDKVFGSLIRGITR